MENASDFLDLFINTVYPDGGGMSIFLGKSDQISIDKSDVVCYNLKEMGASERSLRSEVHTTVRKTKTGGTYT
jgi:hypothetical protein